MGQTKGVQILTRFLSSYVILDKLINPSGPYFLIHKNGANNKNYLTGLLLGLNELVSVKCLE